MAGPTRDEILSAIKAKQELLNENERARWDIVQKAPMPNVDKPLDEIMTCYEVAEMFKCSYRKIAKLARLGKIPHFKIGGVRRFKRSQLLRMMNENMSEDEKS